MIKNNTGAKTISEDKLMFSKTYGTDLRAHSKLRMKMASR